MTPQRRTELTDDLVRLILDHAGSVPHLEALLLLWESAPQPWSVAEIGSRVYITRADAERILRDLAQRGLVVATAPDWYALTDEPAGRERAATIALAYRDNTSRVATLIHAQPSKAVRDFAQAFEIKDRKKD